jgi:ERCC4-related helicase
MKNFAEVKSNDSLLTARKLMYEKSKQISDVRCVVVDESGKAVGIFGYDSIAAFME